MNLPLNAGAPLHQAKRAVILVHGRGATGADMIGLTNYFIAPDTCWLAPSAPGGSWYPHRFLAPISANEPHLSRAFAEIEDCVARVVAAGIARKDIAFEGFSQGACLALEYVLLHPAKYAFVAGLSGALIGPLDRVRETVTDLKCSVLLGCAENDAHIPFEYVQNSARVLGAAGAKITLQQYPGSAHTIYPQEIEWIQHQGKMAI